MDMFQQREQEWHSASSLVYLWLHILSNFAGSALGGAVSLPSDV